MIMWGRRTTVFSWAGAAYTQIWYGITWYNRFIGYHNAVRHDSEEAAPKEFAG